MSFNTQPNDFKSPNGPPSHEPAHVDASPAYTPNPDANESTNGGMPPVRFGLAAAGMNNGPVAQPPNGMIANHQQPGTPGFQAPGEGGGGFINPNDGHPQVDASRATTYSPPQAAYSPPLPQSSCSQTQGGQFPQMQPQFTGGYQTPQPGQQMPYVQTPPPGGAQYQQPGASPYSQPGASPHPQQQQQATSPYPQPGQQGATVQPVVMGLNPVCAQQGHRPMQPTPVCGILWAIFCFPFGLICLFSELGRPPVCAVCGVEVVGPPMRMAPSQQYMQQQPGQQQQYTPQQQQYQQQYQPQPQSYQQPPNAQTPPQPTSSGK